MLGMKLSLQTPKSLAPSVSTVDIMSVRVNLDTGNLDIVYGDPSLGPHNAKIVTAVLSGAQRTAVRNIVKTAVENDLATTTTDLGT